MSWVRREVRQARADAATARVDRDRLARALDACEAGVVVVDTARATLVRNAPARRLEGARHGRTPADEVVDELLEHALLGISGRRELELVGPPPVTIEVRTEPLRRDGEVIGAVAFVHDVSDARRVTSVRRDFVANVSHELKTPVGALAVLAETLAAEDEPVIIRKLAGRVLEETDRLARIVDDLLDLSAIEAPDAPSHAPAAVAPLVRAAVERVRAAAETSGISLDVAPPSDDVEVSCDRRQVLSALVNLLDNAVKYSEPGRPVELRVEADDERVAFVVRDRGVGIPTHELERIFERFYRVDRARSRETGGTGLGLSIVRHVAQAHGGEVTVESREGVGSTFRLVLPRAGDADG